jgi:hypothetical protein
MDYANIYKGDVNSVAMDAATRTQRRSWWIGMAGVFLYLFHVITHVVMHSKKTRTKQFIDIERKVFIPLLAVGSCYLIHFFHWWPVFWLWVLVVFWIASDIACMVEKCRDGFCFKLLFTIALLCGILWWFTYWIQLVYWT